MAMNHFAYVGMINLQINNIFNYFPAQPTMPAAAADSASTSMIHHGIFSFTIPTAMTLVQVRFPDHLLFQTNPILMLLMLCSVIAYSLAFSLELLLRGTPHADVVRPRNWSIASGSLSVASLLSLLLSPPSSWPWLPLLLCFFLLTLLVFAPKLVALVPQLPSLECFLKDPSILLANSAKCKRTKWSLFLLQSLSSSLVSKLSGTCHLIWSLCPPQGAGKGPCLFHVMVSILHCNFFAGFHGGAVAEAVPIACARTVVAKDKEIFLGELSISYLASAKKNAEVIVDASVVRSGRNLSVIALEFKLKKTGDLIYTARATFCHMPAAKL
ncbi:unnamed protein product [Prunus brigantina]